MRCPITLLLYNIAPNYVIFSTSMLGKCIANEMVFVSVFKILKFRTLENFYPLYFIYLKFYFLYFFNFSKPFFPIESKVKNKSTIGLLEARPGYFDDTKLKKIFTLFQCLLFLSKYDRTSYWY